MSHATREKLKQMSSDEICDRVENAFREQLRRRPRPERNAWIKRMSDLAMKVQDVLVAQEMTPGELAAFRSVFGDELRDLVAKQFREWEGI